VEAPVRAAPVRARVRAALERATQAPGAPAQVVPEPVWARAREARVTAD
jgi:hypothetical protein